ncbi:MAG: dihydroneopterin aldolase [Chloroflexota bacterium]
MDKIIIQDLLVRGILGINPEERVNKQDILINVTIFTDVRRAAATDDIRHTVNYKSVTKRMIEHVEGSADLLAEKLTSDLARLILTEFNVERVIVRLEKPGALRFARSVGIEIERTRNE